MANTTLTTAAVTGVSAKMVAACGGGAGKPGASIKAFTATAGSGNFPIAGLALNLSALFPNKVLMAVISPLHDPARASADLAYLAVYVPAANGAPATGKVYIYAATGIMVADDAVDISTCVVTGFAIGY